MPGLLSKKALFSNAMDCRVESLLWLAGGRTGMPGNDEPCVNICNDT